MDTLSLGDTTLLSTVYPGWERRPSQERMAKAVADTVAEGGVLVVEAPTGVGKTLAYLVGACGADNPGKVLVSTHTKTLQDQILDNDLPRLFEARAHAGLKPLVVEVMKGRRNYLCLDRLEKIRAAKGQPAFDFVEDSEADLLQEIETWASQTETGDRSALVGLSEQSVLWDRLDARSERCLGRKCPQYESCFVVRMRTRAQVADVVIVNHHLLLADLALRARFELQKQNASLGQVLPDADHLVIDEAHTLDAIASESFGGSVSGAQVERLLSDVAGFAAELRFEQETAPLTQQVARAQVDVLAAWSTVPQSAETRMAYTGNGLQAALRTSGLRAAQSLEAMAERVDALGNPGLAGRARDLSTAFRFVLEAEDPDFVYWLEKSASKPDGAAASRGVKLGASPVDVARLLKKFVFDRFASTILTSATLSIARDDQSCSYFRTLVGLSDDAASSMVLDSSFDYAAQSALLIPSNLPHKPGVELIETVIQAIRTLGGGALVLSTSVKGMRYLAKEVSKGVDYPCLMQGEAPKRALIAKFMVEAPAVLFATQSFWEGVDIPGDPLRLVVVDRLPFEVPTDPLVQARGAKLQAEGRSPFFHDQLPRAILRLKQAFGRLIRSRKDRGAVLLLDRRVLDKGYGKRFLQALPPAQRLNSIEALSQWWEAM